MKLLAEFDLDVFPPTANHIQQSTRSGRRYDTAAYKAFKAQFTALVGDKLKELKSYEGKPLCLAVVYRWSGWYTKAGAIRKQFDASNRFKALEDAIFKAIGIDDAYNVMPLMQKAWPRPGRDRYIECRIYDTQGHGLWELLDTHGLKNQAVEAVRSNNDTPKTSRAARFKQAGPENNSGNQDRREGGHQFRSRLAGLPGFSDEANRDASNLAAPQRLSLQPGLSK